jgi:hypothetical protein
MMNVNKHSRGHFVSRLSVDARRFDYGVFSNPVCHREARVAPRRSNPAGSPRRDAASRNDRFENTPLSG